VSPRRPERANFRVLVSPDYLQHGEVEVALAAWGAASKEELLFGEEPLREGHRDNHGGRVLEESARVGTGDLVRTRVEIVHGSEASDAAIRQTG
jgi:hypothetical protein